MYNPMKYRGCFLFLLFIGCNQAYTYKEVFKIENARSRVDLGLIHTVEQFDELYCGGNKNLPLILPFDFENGVLDSTSSFGIPAIGHPMRCHPALCCKYAVSILVKDKVTWIYDLDVEINAQDLDSLVRTNILNYGYFPSLSDEPKDALFIISAEATTPLTDLNLILNEISNSYINLLKDEAPEGNTDLFSLNLIITTFFKPPPIPIDTTLNNEIEKEIMIDIKGST